jgi:hypothetical protein
MLSLKKWLRTYQSEIIHFITDGGKCIPPSYAKQIDSLNEYFADKLEGKTIRQLDLHAVVQRECPLVLHVRFDQYDKNHIRDWCALNAEGIYACKANSFALHKGYCHKIQFKNKKDAMLFKLSFETY